MNIELFHTAFTVRMCVHRRLSVCLQEKQDAFRKKEKKINGKKAIHRKNRCTTINRPCRVRLVLPFVVGECLCEKRTQSCLHTTWFVALLCGCGQVSFRYHGYDKVQTEPPTIRAT